MEVKPFNRRTDTNDLALWLHQRGIDPHFLATLPRMGFMAFYEGVPIACAFIRGMEGGFGFLDGLASNPIASPELRNDALDSVVAELMTAAKSAGMKAILSWSKDSNTLVRSEKHGFKKFPETVIIADLTSKAQS